MFAAGISAAHQRGSHIIPGDRCESRLRTA